MVGKQIKSYLYVSMTQISFIFSILILVLLSHHRRPLRSRDFEKSRRLNLLRIYNKFINKHLKPNYC